MTLEVRGPAGSQQVRVAYWGATPVTYPEEGTSAWVLEQGHVRIRLVEDEQS